VFGGSSPPALARANTLPALLQSASSVAAQKRAATLSAFAKLRRVAPTLLKHGRRGKPHLSELRIHDGALHWNWEDWRAGDEGEGAAPNPKSLPLASVTAVLAGRKTDALQRSAKPAEDKACFALVAPGRQLSLQIVSGSEADRDLWVAGLNIFIDTLRHEQTYWDGELEAGVRAAAAQK
jgi:hypothetical protein